MRCDFQPAEAEDGWCRCVRCPNKVRTDDCATAKARCRAGGDDAGVASGSDGLDCVHLGVDTGRTVQWGRCPGSLTGVYTCDLLAEYCLPLARRSATNTPQTAGYMVCRGCSGFAADRMDEMDEMDGMDGRTE